MSVSFEPDSEIMTGTFDISRIAQRSAEERPHKHSVSIEAGLATPTDISEDIEEETVEEEIEEEAEDQEEEVAASETSDEDESQPNGEGAGRRRRRRRGGRGRNRSRNREDRPQEMQEAIPNAPMTEGDFESEPGDAVAQGELPDNGSVEDAENQQGEGGQRRRRRRRRGRRGRRDGEGHQQSYANDLEGAPGDAGTPDTDLTVPKETHEPLAAKPNAESAPVWSLGSNEQPHRARQNSAPEPAQAEPVPAQPPKKGWWQRAFSPKE
jgi:ribonuclease E